MVATNNSHSQRQKQSREPEVSPFCVRRQSETREPQSVRNQSASYKSNGYAEQTSFTTFDAIQNVQVREPSSNQNNKCSLDNLISSNRASNNDMKKDHLYWERVSTKISMSSIEREPHENPMKMRRSTLKVKFKPKSFGSNVKSQM